MKINFSSGHKFSLNMISWSSFITSCTRLPRTPPNHKGHRHTTLSLSMCIYVLCILFLQLPCNHFYLNLLFESFLLLPIFFILFNSPNTSPPPPVFLSLSSISFVLFSCSNSVDLCSISFGAANEFTHFVSIILTFSLLFGFSSSHSLYSSFFSHILWVLCVVFAPASKRVLISLMLRMSCWRVSVVIHFNFVNFFVVLTIRF